MDERSERIAKRFEVPVVVAALLVIPVMVIEQARNLEEPWDTIAAIGNSVIWLVFFAEAIVMLSVVPDKRKWLRGHVLEVAIVLFTPPFMPASLQAARVLRLLRLVRLGVVFRVLRRFTPAQGLGYAAILTVFLVLAGGAAYTEVEKGYQHTSTWEGVYWAVTTVTTVGYGDPGVHSEAGRVIAVVLMIVGIGFVAMLTAALAQRFLQPQLEELEAEGEEIETVGLDLQRRIRAMATELQKIELDLQRLVVREAGKRRGGA